MIKRCPWCGEDARNNSRGFAVYGKKCMSCGNEFISYRKNPLYIFLSVLTILFFIVYFILDAYFVNLPDLVFLPFISLGLAELLLTICPYIKQTNHYVNQKRQVAAISFYPEFHKQARLFVTENQIFTLCFVGENDIPISKMICAATESVKYKKNECKCILAFLPLGNLDKIYSTGTKFYFYFNNKVVGSGILGEELKGFNTCL